MAENCALLRPVTRQGYRADAAISVAGISIFSRKGAGSVFLILREGSHNERTISTLHLAGGSRPERTHGLEYFGSIEEAIVEQSSSLTEAAYFSFVTTRPEEWFEDARRCTLSNSCPPEAFVAVEAAHSAGRVRNRRASVVVPDRRPVALNDLIPQARIKLLEANAVAREIDLNGDTGGANVPLCRALRRPLASEAVRMRIYPKYAALPAGVREDS